VEARLANCWQHVVHPVVLAEMWRDGVHHCELVLEVGHQHKWVRCTLLANHIGLF
jgi:hypothetical protein